jgi:hypothetical protein
MKQIKLHGKSGLSALVDDADYLALSKYKWYLGTKGYVIRNEYLGDGKNTTVRMARAVMGFPVALQVDHRNRNKLDNRRSNLRAVTNGVNQTNKGIAKNNTSGYKNIHFDKAKKLWRLDLFRSGKHITKRRKSLSELLSVREAYLESAY